MADFLGDHFYRTLAKEVVPYIDRVIEGQYRAAQGGEVLRQSGFDVTPSGIDPALVGAARAASERMRLDEKVEAVRRAICESKPF